MNIGKFILLLIMAAMMAVGCFGKEKISHNSIASEDPDFRKIMDLCEQEAQARCWKPADSSPVYLNEIMEKRRQSKCRKDWISSCMEKHGYELKQ